MGKAQTQLTHVNEALFSQLDLTMPEELEVTPTAHADAIQGHAIDTFVQLPPGFNASKKYPAILNIHGGPALGLWMDIRSRDVMDGGAGICGGVSQPARVYFVWRGFCECN